jgi:hypothetical protein
MRRRLVRDGRVAVVFVRYDRFEDQLAQLAHECGLARVDLPRCLVCNARLRAAGPFEAASHVPEYVARTQRHFRYCPTCDRYVWEGTHWRKMCTLLRRVGVAGA